MRSIALGWRAGLFLPATLLVIGCDRSPTSWDTAARPRFSIVPGSGSWTTRASMPTARSAMGVAALNGLLYAVGGRSDNVLSTMEAYDPATDTWTSKAPMPTARNYLGVVALNGILYALGGVSYAGYFATVEAYDPSTDTWTTKAPMPIAACCFSAVAINGILYIVGLETLGGHSNSVYAYNPATETWTTKAPMPTVRAYMGAAAVNGILYAVGGAHLSAMTTVEAYDPTTDTWATRAPMPTPRWLLGAAAINGSLYAVGGLDDNVDPEVYRVPVVAYDPATDTWTTLAPIPTPRAELGVAEISGVLYAVGGMAGPLGSAKPSAILEAFIPNAGNTPTGSNVTVTAANPDGTPAQGVTLTFQTVTREGQTTLTTSGTGTPPPNGFTLGDPAVYYDLSTTATFSGIVTVCIDYSGIQFGTSPISLFHLESGSWVDRTSSVDVTNHIVCAEVTSLSPFLIAADVPPTVGGVSAPAAPVQINTVTSATASFTDPGIGFGDTHTALISWGDGASANATVGESNGSGSASGSHTYTAAGVYTVTVTVTDKYGAKGQSSFQFVVVFDPSAGFVTGSGWITSPVGAYVPSPNLTGRATFGFVSRYQKGTSVPSGNTEFDFQTASFGFRSTSYDWLVISGAKAQFKGSGTVNGAGKYGFLLTAVDGAVSGGGGVDRFRLKVWDRSTGSVIYDNQMGADQTADPTTALGSGDIVIHK